MILDQRTVHNKETENNTNAQMQMQEERKVKTRLPTIHLIWALYLTCLSSKPQLAITVQTHRPITHPQIAEYLTLVHVFKHEISSELAAV